MHRRHSRCRQHQRLARYLGLHGRGLFKNKKHHLIGDTAAIPLFVSLACESVYHSTPFQVMACRELVLEERNITCDYVFRSKRKSLYLEVWYAKHSFLCVHKQRVFNMNFGREKHTVGFFNQEVSTDFPSLGLLAETNSTSAQNRHN